MPKQAAPTLIDRVYRLSFRNELVPGWRSNSDMRRALEASRRFMVDEPMARFMAELANESFLKVGGNNPIVLRIADSLRVQARLPHDTIWIEYPLRAYQDRSHELRGQQPIDPSELPKREGWLIQQHPGIETAHIMHLFTDDEVEHFDGMSLWTFPLALGWCADDSPLPWRVSAKQVTATSGPGEEPYYAMPSSILAGLSRYDRDNVNCVRSPLITDPVKDIGTGYYNYLLSEWMGVLRRVWALLATIDHIPLTRGEVRQSKGFLARGRIRKYLNHTTITLNVPGKTNTRVLARKVIALAHRARHEVRAHWRNDWRNPPSSRCNPHLWEPLDNDADIIRCDICSGRQFHIHKHMRGTGEIGLTTHDYVVKHEESPT
jgi:hypothetical protein